MQMMIFAAGRGRRLAPLTDRLPKPLVKVGEKPLIEYHLERAIKLGITDVVINVSYLGQMIIDALGDGRRWGLNIRYSLEASPLETAGGLVKARALLNSGQFLLCNADIFHEINLTEFTTRVQFPARASNSTTPHSKTLGSNVHLIMVPNPLGQKGDFWVAQNGQVSAFEIQGQSASTYSGLGIYHTDFIDDIDQLASGNPEHQRTPYYLKRWMEAGRVYGQIHEEYWCDVGTPERLNQLNQRLLTISP